jgi:predicted metal-dependent phosphoesterase TrpH
MSWSLIVHAHTKHSFDSITEPKAIVARALELGVNVIAVTDHNTWRGAVDVLGVVDRTNAPLRVIVASEVFTDHGDVIGLFLKDDLRFDSAAAFCDAVHEQEGLVLLPHPYRWHELDDELLTRVDLIEVYNARTSAEENRRAAELAKSRRLPALVGPDAHRLGELDLARVEFEGDLPPDEKGLKRALLEAPRRFHTRSGSIWNEWLSQGVRLLRRPSGALAWNLARGALRRVVKPRAYTTE